MASLTRTNDALSLRESAILIQLARFRFLATGQVERFLFSRSDPTTESSRKTIIHRTLIRLVRRGLITRTPRTVGGSGSGSGAHVYYLTNAGSTAARSLTPSPPPRRAVLRGTFLLRHAIAVAEVALAFRAAAAEHDSHDLLAFECDWEIGQRIGNDFLVPDAFLIYGSADLELHAFFEVDLGTAGSRVFQRKVERYLELHRGGTWQRTLRVWPTVLTIAPTPTRTALLKRGTEAVLSDRDPDVRRATEFAFATLPELVEDGALARIWMVAGCSGRHHLFATNGKDHDEHHS